MRRRKEDRPLRDVVGEPLLNEGRGSVLGPDTARRTRWWEMTLSCGHTVERIVKYAPDTANPGRRGGGKGRPLSAVGDPPRRARCDRCRGLA